MFSGLGRVWRHLTPFQQVCAILAIVARVAFCIFGALYGPYITIWALNTLFKCGIEYNWATWAAMAWINVTLVCMSRGSKS